MSSTPLGQHELIERLGQGAMGVVWKARDTRTGGLVALKVLAESAGGRRFRREFRAASRLDHDNVVRVIEMGTANLEGSARSWFTMELVVGSTLRQLLDREAAGWPPRRNSPEWLASRLSLLHQAALGLEHCHSNGVLHRDLKPTNLLLDSEGLVKLADFGLARVDERVSSLSGAGQLIGTVAYMAPEQARGGPIDARSDVHGLGALMHELATGLPPFRAQDLPSLLMQVLFEPAPDPRAANPDLLEALAELSSSCLAKDPLERPQSAAEVARRLRAIAAERGIELDAGPAALPCARVRPLAPQLVGREEERRLVRSALERARTEPVAVSLSGPSGVGKSRLAEELRVDAELMGFRVLASSATPSARPLGTLREALRLAIARAPDEARNDVDLLTNVLPELLSGEPRDEDGSADEAAPADRLRVAWAAEAVLTGLLETGPHVLLLDDLQWVDPLSARVIERLIERESGPLLLLTIFRDDLTEPRPGTERLREALAARPDLVALVLSPLDREGVAGLVESMLGKPPTREVAEQLWQATSGLPQDVDQVVRELAARGAVRADGAELSLDLPASVDLSELSASEATRSHLEALGPLARRVVFAVVLAGRGVGVATLSEALATDEEALLDELEVLINEGFLRDGPGPDVISLAHDRLREAIVSSSSADELGPIRGALARALERAGEREGGPHRVAELDLAAGSLEEARRTVPPSAERFAAAGLHAAALERYEALIALAEQLGEAAPPQARLRRAELLAQAGRTEEMASAYAALAEDESARPFVPLWDALRQQAFGLMLLTRHAEAERVLERAIAAAEEAGDASGLSRALSVLGTVVDRVGRDERCWELHLEAVRVARERGSATDLAMALNNHGVAAYRRGRLGVASAAYEEAAALFEARGDRLHAANCRSNLAAVLLARGEPEASRPIAREVLSSMRRLVDVRGLSRVQEVLGLAALELGDVDEAEAALAESMAIRDRLAEPWARGETALNLARVALYRCQWPRAEELLQRARRLFEAAGDRERGVLVAARLGELAWQAGRSGARGLFEEALATAEAEGARLARAEALLGLARLEVDEGAADAACARLRGALEDARELDSEEQALSLESELLVARLAAGDVAGLAREAERVAARAPRRPAAARSRDALAAAAALRATGEGRRADECLLDGEALLLRLGESLPEEERERFARQHLHARLLELARAGGAERDEEERMPESERAELARLRTFHRLVMASDTAEPESLLETFVSAAIEELGFARGLVFSSRGGELVCRVARDAAGRDIPKVERRVPDQLLRHALERGEPVLSLGLRDDPALSYEGSVEELKVEAFAAVPVGEREDARVVAYFDGPPPERDLPARLLALAPVFSDFGKLLDRAKRVKTRTERADAILSSLSGGEGPIIGLSRAVEDLRRLIRTVAPTDASVLVLGENGTGKELVARELHLQSGRREAPLLIRSCAELTETLLESELFGHEKGAFTGAARDRAGLFEAASGGTLFLDEVGEMSASLQAKLLRVLETGELTRIGSTTTRKVDVRIVAATHRDLTAAVQAGTFRQDLYYRLKVIELRVPALRERREDLSLLAHHFLALSARGREGAPRAFTHEALRALARHDWPGNVRELRNVIERAVILAGQRDEIGCDLLPEELRGADGTPLPDGTPRVSGNDLRGAREAFERACIERALEENAGNRTHAAKALGISIRSLQQKIARHGVG